MTAAPITKATTEARHIHRNAHYTFQSMFWLFFVLLVIAGTPSRVYQRGVALYKQQKYAKAAQALQEAARTEDPKSVEYKESALLIGRVISCCRRLPRPFRGLRRCPP